MEYQEDQPTQIEALQEHRNLLVVLISEYRERLKYNHLSEDEHDHSTCELAALQAQLDSIDATLVKLENESDIKSPRSPSE